MSMGKPIEVLVLAAGLSTRLGQHKAMIDVNGKPLIPVSYTHLTLPTILLV